MMRVLLFVLHASKVKVCEGAMVTARCLCGSGLFVLMAGKGTCILC